MKNFNIVIKQEREFAGNHPHWFDLKRTGVLVKPSDLYNKDIHMPANLKAGGNGVFENALLRPAPQNKPDASLNGDEPVQNPGYNQDNILITQLKAFFSFFILF